MGVMETWWRRHPLGLCALAAVLGIWLEESQRGGAQVWLGLALITLAGVAMPVPGKTSRTLWIWLLVASAFGALHSLRQAESFEHPMLAWMETPGAVTERPVRVEARVLQSQIRPDGRVRCLIETATIDETVPGGATWRQPCRLQALLPAGQPPLPPARCTLAGTLRPPMRAANDGEFDSRAYSLREGVLGSLAVTRVVSVQPSWSLSGMLQAGADFCRASIQRRLSAGLEDQPEALSVIQGMVLGASEDTDPRIEDAFRRSGTLHVFAVSGLHVGLIAVVLHLLLRPLRLRRQHLVPLVVVLVFSYAYITGWRPSAARAAMMVAVLLGGSLVMRRANLINSLGGAALLLLAWNTQVLFQAGFQLSFGVLLAIALLAGPLLDRFRPWTELDPFLPPALASWSVLFLLWLRRQVAGLAAVSAAAWLGSLPLMWYHFHTVTPAALLANCLLIPLAFVTLGAACMSLTVSLMPFLGWLQVLLNQCCALMAGLMIKSAGLFAALPGASLNLPPLTQSREPAAVEMRWFALPNGAEAGLLRAGGRDWLLDCGNERSFGRVVYPALRQAGVNRIEGLFLSHSDANHVGGLEAAMRSLPVTTLFHPLHEPWLRSASKLRQSLQILELDPTHPPRRLGAGDVIQLSHQLRPARLTVLYPAAQDALPQADDRGMVARLELGRLRVLWTADAGFITETALLARREELRCDVLVRGAHESDNHGTWSFLQAAAPALILSAGSDHIPELKLPESVRRYAAENQIPLLVLPDCGEVTLRLPSQDADHFTVETYQAKKKLTIPLRR